MIYSWELYHLTSHLPCEGLVTNSHLQTTILWLPARWASGFSGDHQQMHQCLCCPIFCILLGIKLLLLLNFEKAVSQEWEGWLTWKGWKGCELKECCTHFVTFCYDLDLEVSSSNLKKNLYPRSGMADWHRTKGMWVDWKSDPLCLWLRTLTSPITLTWDFQCQIF